MKTHFLHILCMLLCCFPFIKAQEGITVEQLASTNEITEELGQIPESFDSNVDSLLHSWHVQYFTQKDAFCHDDNVNVQFADSIYEQRLKALPSIVPLTYNNIVKDCISLYADRKRGLVRYMMGMADFYFPVIEQVLDERDLPIELKYLAVVESALNPMAISRVGASGLWQFMLPTAKSYGLEVNSLVDERRDIVKSTYAACKYFEDMYKIYGDWHLVLASYNCGPGNVNKAIRRAGGKTDFWEIFPYLPKETRSYVPLFIAATYIMNYHCDHNLCPLQTDLPLATDTVMVNNLLHLEQVADMLQMDIEQLRALNPQYKRDIVPGRGNPRVLKLPAVKTYEFTDKEDTVYIHRIEELLASAASYDEAQSTAARKEQITHIASGTENLYTIADEYGVTAKDIRKWNGLSSNKVPRGKKLRLYVDNGGIAIAASTGNSTKPETPVEKVTQVTNKDNSKGEFVNYKVQQGDSLYSISKKYPGVSADKLREANELSSANIRPGQILKIPVV